MADVSKSVMRSFSHVNLKELIWPDILSKSVVVEKLLARVLNCLVQAKSRVTV